MATNYEEAFKRLDQFIEQKMKVTNVPGMAVAVTDREKLNEHQVGSNITRKEHCYGCL